MRCLGLVVVLEREPEPFVSAYPQIQSLFSGSVAKACLDVFEGRGTWDSRQAGCQLWPVMALPVVALSFHRAKRDATFTCHGIHAYPSDYV